MMRAHGIHGIQSFVAAVKQNDGSEKPKELKDDFFLQKSHKVDHKSAV